MSEIDRRVNTALRDAVRQRNYRRVRDRALARLKKLHPEDYARLFEEERERDEAEAKSWLDISGRTKRSMGSAGTPDRNSTVSEPHKDRVITEEGNLG